MKEKTMVVKSHDVNLDSEYTQWICEIKDRYRRTR